MEMPEKVCIRSVLARLCIDVDIFLLCEEDQETTKDELYTPEQIRKQLKFSMEKLCMVLDNVGICTRLPLPITKAPEL